MIKILCVGKIKEKFFRDATSEYLKRISKYSKIEIIEVNDVDLNNKELNLEKEKDNLMKYINEKDFIVTLEIEGKQLSSEEFSQMIDKTLINYPNITFIIGGSYGIHNDIKKKSNLKLSFSKLTFPHQLFRIILLEQIYRGFKIVKNESYHK
ncbi:MAG: 23S rRNA (pseudouridine(1915)-N(3))-methyltransferase RlmH [Firmicutes bacterium]|nr:23S rRNA (pseudouridine(1915)-N(3))-methyltransferase RlmH [Bacillota bacterium]